MKHGLTGYLAGLSVLVGGLESPRVLSCLTRCQEALDTPAMELLQPSMELLTNNGGYGGGKGEGTPLHHHHHHHHHF